MARPNPTLTRRSFLGRASAGAFVAWLHGGAALAGPASDPAGAPAPAEPRIRALRLRTAAPLDTLEAFYHGRIGFEVLDRLAESITFAAGLTPLTFVRDAPGGGRPFYHFAFNIPENKIRAARDWQRERTPLIPVPERLRDPDYPDDIVDYSHWNAHSVFFFDPAENVVEYIARHDLGNAATGGFDTPDILYASEIAFVVDDVPQAAGVLRGVAAVPQYRGGDEQFMALGDEHGLLLVFHRGRVISLASERTKAADVFPVVARVRGATGAKPLLESYPYTIVAG